MKKTKLIKVQKSPQLKPQDKSLSNDIDNDILIKRKNTKKNEHKKNLTTKANTTITDSSKDEKKEEINKKKSEHEKKIKKENNMNKTLEISGICSNKKMKSLKSKSKSNLHFMKNSSDKKKCLRPSNSTKAKLTKKKNFN